jgi:DNA-binding MarR family transcriptional regulator
MSTRERPEPDAFSPTEFAAWRGMLRVHATVTRELERRLAEAGGLSLSDYALLITLVGAPGRRLSMSELARRMLLHPSRITRVVGRLEQEGLVARQADESDARSVQAVLTSKGLEQVRVAQITHHAAVRELYLARLTEAERHTLGGLLEKAMPGVVSSEVWPPYE